MAVQASSTYFYGALMTTKTTFPGTEYSEQPVRIDFYGGFILMLILSMEQTQKYLVTQVAHLLLNYGVLVNLLTHRLHLQASQSIIPIL